MRTIFLCAFKEFQKKQNFMEVKLIISALNIKDEVSRTSCMSPGTCNILKMMGKEMVLYKCSVAFNMRLQLNCTERALK
jgi:hypothetical protein